MRAQEAVPWDSEESSRLLDVATRAWDVVDTLSQLLTVAKASARELEETYDKARREERRRAKRKGRANG